MPRDTPPSLISYTEIAYNSTTSPRASASISWLTNDVVVFLYGDEGAGTTVTAPTATGLTFTQQKLNSTASTCKSGVWTAVAASGSSGVVNGGHAAPSANWGASVWVWRGSDGVGVSFEQHTATKTVSAVPTDTHSSWMWGIFDFAAGAAGGSTQTPTVTNARQVGEVVAGAYSIWAGDEDDQASASSTPYGITTGTASTGPFSIVGVEVLGTTSGVSSLTVGVVETTSSAEVVGAPFPSPIAVIN